MLFKKKVQNDFGPRMYTQLGKIKTFSELQGPRTTSLAWKHTCDFGFGVQRDADGLRILKASSQPEC